MNILDFDQTKYAYWDTNRPTFRGTTPESHPNTEVRIVIGDKQFTADFNPTDRKWSWTPDEDISDGVYSLAIFIIDAAGNVGTPTLRTLVIDTTPPEAPELINLKDDVGAITGSFDPGELTDDKRPTLTGVAQPNTIVYLRDPAGNDIGSAKTDALTGKWVIEPNNDLHEGPNALTLVAIEEFGKDASGKPIYREGKSSNPFIINIGTDDFITIDDALDNVGKWSGVLDNGALTDDSTPTLRGQVNDGATVVTIYYRNVGDNTWSGSATATINGKSWSWTPSAELPVGNYEFQASTLKVSSALFNLDIFPVNTGDSQTIITQVWDDAGTKTGKLISGDFTDDMTPQFSGRAEANSKVVIQYSHNGIDYSTTVEVGHNGNWTWTPATNLVVGDWSFKVKSEGTSVWNDNFELHIYPEASVATSITQVFDDVGVTGPIGNNGITDDSTPTLSGKTEANAIVVIYDGKLKLGSAKANSSGDWSFVTTALPDGSHNFWAIQQGYSTPSNAWKIEIDTSGIGPDHPTITGLFEHQSNGDYSKFMNGGLINDGSVKVEGVGRALSTINIYDGTTLLGTATAGADGTWSYLHHTNFLLGHHTITATEAKGPGSESAPSNKAEFTLVGDGSGTGDGSYQIVFAENALVEGTRSFSSGYNFRGHLGGKLKILEGSLYSKANSFVKTQPGSLKTLEDSGKVVFETDATTDFNMSLYGVSASGSASLTFYSITGAYLGSQYFSGDAAYGIRTASYIAPQGQVIGKVQLQWNDTGGVAINGVSYGATGSDPFRGSESFSRIPDRINTTGNWTDGGLKILGGAVYNSAGKLQIYEKEPFSFTVGRTTDIHFSTGVGAQVTFYDANGNVLHDEYYYSSRVDYVAPPGEMIYKITITPYGQTNIIVDDVSWGNNLGSIDYGYNSAAGANVLQDGQNVDVNGLIESSAIVDMQDGKESVKEITLEDILSNGEVGLFTAENTTQLMIQGDNNDVVQLKDILPEGDNVEAWTQQQGSVTVAGVEYTVYNHTGDNAQLLVQSEIKVEMI